MLDFITSLGSWNWFILGFVLLAVEVMVPGYFFLWIGVSALIVGFSTLLITWPWQIQLLGFAVLSVASAYFGKRMLGYADDEASEDPHLNKRGSRLEGRTFRLEEAIEHYPGSMIIVTHDRYFLNRVATHILSFEGDGRVIFHHGDYESYKDWKIAQGENPDERKGPHRQFSRS